MLGLGGSGLVVTPGPGETEGAVNEQLADEGVGRESNGNAAGNVSGGSRVAHAIVGGLRKDDTWSEAC